MGTISQDTRRACVNAVKALPNIDAEATRAALTADWPPQLRQSATLSGSTQVVIPNLVNAAADWRPADSGETPPLVLMLQIAQGWVEGSEQGAVLASLITTVRAELESTSRTAVAMGPT